MICEDTEAGCTRNTDAQGSGNTNPSPKKLRARAYQITINQVELYEKFRDHFMNLKSCTYGISCKEIAPTTGHEHIHLYVHFQQAYIYPQKLAQYKQHVEICRGSPKQNIEYIKKDGNILDEWGEEPHQGVKTVAEMRDMNMGEVDPHLYRIKKEIDEDYRRDELWDQLLTSFREDDLRGPEIIYLTGPPGCGKTTGSWAIATYKYKKNKDIGRITCDNGFICIDNKYAKCFIIDEFRGSQIPAASFLQLTDKFGYNCNIKGGHFFLKPETIIIASWKRPDQLYLKEELNKQFTRRITCLIDMYIGESIEKYIGAKRLDLEATTAPQSIKEFKLPLTTDLPHTETSGPSVASKEAPEGLHAPMNDNVVNKGP